MFRKTDQKGHGSPSYRIKIKRKGHNTFAEGKYSCLLKSVKFAAKLLHQSFGSLYFFFFLKGGTGFASVNDKLEATEARPSMMA